MRKAWIFGLVVFGLLLVSSFVLAVGNGNGQNSDVPLPKYKVTHEEIQELKQGKFAFDFQSGKIVEGRVFFHHKPSHGGGPGGGGGGGNGGGSSCFAFLGNGVKWKTTEQYVLDTTNADGMSDGFVSSVTATSFETWDSEVGFDIFGTEDTGSVVDGPDTVSPDGKNEVMFGSIGSPGAIAVTIVWGIFTGPPFNRKIVEYDVVFDDPDFVWGDASVDPNVMDYQNIATHEFGHSAGLDHPGNDCTEETMYAFAGEGETKKRDLNAGDIAGVTDLYN